MDKGGGPGGTSRKPLREALTLESSGLRPTDCGACLWRSTGDPTPHHRRLTGSPLGALGAPGGMPGGPMEAREIGARSQEALTPCPPARPRRPRRRRPRRRRPARWPRCPGPRSRSSWRPPLAHSAPRSRPRSWRPRRPPGRPSRPRRPSYFFLLFSSGCFSSHAANVAFTFVLRSS